MFNDKDVMETISMIRDNNLDIRTNTMGISLLDCADTDADKACTKYTTRSAALQRIS